MAFDASHFGERHFLCQTFAEYCLFYRALLQKRPIILRSLLIVATPYLSCVCIYACVCVCACACACASTRTHIPRHTLIHTHTLTHTPPVYINPVMFWLSDKSGLFWTWFKGQNITSLDPVTHCNTLQHTATHCNTLQHTATHCNTLQHTEHSISRSSTASPDSPHVIMRHIMFWPLNHIKFWPLNHIQNGQIICKMDMMCLRAKT